MQNYEKTFQNFGSYFYSFEGVEWLHTALKIVEKSTLNMFLYVAFSEHADPELAADLGTWLLNFKAKKSIFKKISKRKILFNNEKFEAILVRKEKFSLAVNLDLREKKFSRRPKKRKEIKKHINCVSNDNF